MYINDSALRFISADQSAVEQVDEDGFPSNRSRDVPLRFTINAPPTLQVQPAASEPIDVVVVSFAASFGGDAFFQSKFTSGIGPGIGSQVVSIASNAIGCQIYSSQETELAKDSVLLVRRGSCTFIEKLAFAKRAGARGVVVISDSDTPINPSADSEELEQFAADNIDDAVLVLVTKSDGEKVERLIAASKSQENANVVLMVEPEGQTGKTVAADSTENGGVHNRQSVPENRVLYLNGHPLLNTRLLV